MNFGFIAKAPEHLAGGMAMRSNGRIAVGLPAWLNRSASARS
jgi:hypothetical protein